MHHCLKRRLLFAASQAYQPDMEVHRRTVGWTARPVTIRRAVAGRVIDVALLGPVREGIAVAFRGSLPPFFDRNADQIAVLLDWLNDGVSLPVADPAWPGRVHWGFAGSVHRLWRDDADRPGIRSAVQALIDGGARPHLFLTGHSKGGALANLAAWRASTEPGWERLSVSVATFAAARAGDAVFAAAYDASTIACLRYELPGDLVPHLPPGPGTPGWVRDAIRSLAPGLAASDWRGVGLRIGPSLRHQAWEGSRRRLLPDPLGRRGAGLAVLPRLVAQHAICPGSAYDQLVCTGEPGCTHGEAA